jgi:hypothetical protein
MEQHPAIRAIVAAFQNTQDRYEAHRKLQPLIQELCDDRGFLFDGVRHYFSRPGALVRARRLSLPLFESGDISVALNLFAPFRDGAVDTAADNIHHHGWRVLTTGVICGQYHFVEFRRRSHESRIGDTVNLQIDKVSNHVRGSPRTIPSHTPHVVFRPTTLCCTLAVWSADRLLLSQAVKKHTASFPLLRRAAVRTAHFARLGGILGLNPIRSVYFRPERGRIVEARNYTTPEDGEPEDVLGCIFHLMQLLEFNDVAYLKKLASDSPPAAAALIKRMLAGEQIRDIGVMGDPRQRFSKTQILQALNKKSELMRI